MYAAMRAISLAFVALVAFASVSIAGPSKSLLSRASKRTGIIPLDTTTFNKIMNEGISNRNDFSMTILFTALDVPGVDCKPCGVFQPAYDDVAAAWKKTVGKSWEQGSAPHYFAEVNFKDGQQAFAQMQLTHAPIVFYVPAGAPTNKGISFDFNAHGFDASPFNDWLSQLIGRSTGYRKPFPWRSVATFSLSALIVTTAALFVMAKFQSAMEASGSGGTAAGQWRVLIGWVLQFFSLSLITIMCSGYMWNKIRGAPHVNMGAGGQIEYFAGGFQNQVAIETQIVAAICEYAVPNQRLPRLLTIVIAALYLHRWSTCILSRRTHDLCAVPKRPSQAASRRIRLERHLPRRRQPPLCRVPHQEVSRPDRVQGGERFEC